MVDYKFKAKVLESGLPLEQRKISKTFYNYYYHKNIEFSYPLDFASDLHDYYMNTQPNEYLEAIKINHAYYQRVKRLKNKIANMLDKGNCLFLTFTFTDKILATTSADTRRQKVRRFLSQYNCDYVANIDFGSKNGREHYHALIQTDKVNYNTYDYGALNGEKIRSTTDFVKLAKYISKLTNHAIKDTCKGSRMIYNK